jgi:4-hydroxybenzoate polyprenyltransferase
LKANNPQDRVGTLLRMLKLPHCMFLGFSVIAAETISTANVPIEIGAYGFVAGFLLSAASIVLNDDHSDSPSTDSSGTGETQTALRMIRRDTITLAMVFGVVGLSVASKLGHWTLLVAITILAFTACQDVIWERHRLASGALASGNVALLFVFGGFAVGYPTLSLAILVVLVFVSDLGREIMKDMARSKVDSPNAMAVSGKRSVILFVSGAALSVVPALMGIVSISYLPLIVIFDIGMLLTSYSIRANPTPRTAARDENYVLLWMSFAVLAFIIGTL